MCRGRRPSQGVPNGTMATFESRGLLDRLAWSIASSRFYDLIRLSLTIGSIADTTTSTQQCVVGGDSQPSVDVIGIIVNGNLIENEDEIDTFISINSYLDVDFIFAQAKTTEGFDASTLGDLGDFADNFIEEDRSSTDSKEVKNLREIKNKIYKESKYFKRRNPNAYIYYITTGLRPENDKNF